VKVCTCFKLLTISAISLTLSEFGESMYMLKLPTIIAVSVMLNEFGESTHMLKLPDDYCCLSDAERVR